MRSSPHAALVVTVTALIAALAVARPAPAQTAQMDYARIAAAALGKHIQPGYRRLAEAFAALDNAAAAACSTPGAQKLQALRDRFAASAGAWGGIAHIDFGPVRDGNRYERIWYWPDHKGIGRRQVAGALRDKPADYTRPDSLAGKSVGVQGFSALEDVLYGDHAASLAASDDGTAFLCGYVTALTANLKKAADEIDAAWRADGAFAGSWLHPGKDNPAFVQDQEPVYALIKAYSEGLERLRDTELSRPLGVTKERRVLSGPFAGSKLTMVYIAARTAGLRSLYVQSGIGDELMRLAKAKPDRAAEKALKQALADLEQAEKRAGELARIPDLLGASPQRLDAIALGFPLRDARAQVGQAVGVLTNLPIGFNANDGD